MPLPKPRSGEQREEFLGRCMGNPTALADFPDRSQRYAVCNNLWTGKKGEVITPKTMYQYKGQKFELKDMDMKARTIAGYFSSFDRVDSMGDVMRKGAFTKTIAEQGPGSSRPRIKHLLNHDVSMPVGKLIVLEEDDYGLFYVSEMGTNAAAEDALKMIDSGLITEHSIGYQVSRSRQVYKEMEDGSSNVNELLEVKLFEGSILTGWGVNQYTPLIAQIKSNPNATIDRIKRLEKFVSSSTATDECIQMLMIEIKQLHQVILEAKAEQEKQAAVEAPAQTKSAEVDWSLVATYLNI